MDGNKHTGVAVGVDTDDYMTYGQAGQLRTKVIEIGDWDMDADHTVNVTHGLTLSKIRSVCGVIRNDADTTYYPITPGSIASATEVNLYASIINSTVVTLFRVTGSIFDGASFDSTTYNRGWVTIQYTD